MYALIAFHLVAVALMCVGVGVAMAWLVWMGIAVDLCVGVGILQWARLCTP
jgi:hypothetical protein